MRAPLWLRRVQLQRWHRKAKKWIEEAHVSDERKQELLIRLENDYLSKHEELREK